MINELELMEKIIGILDKDSCLEKKNEKEYWYEVYADYRDNLGEESIKEILSKGNRNDKYDCFYEMLNDMYCFSDMDVLDNYVDLVKENLSEEEYEYNSDFIFECLREWIYFEYPSEHYLNTKVCANLILDVGDADYDFSVNDFRYIDENEIPDESAILWLAKQQGYSKEQLKEAVFHDNYNGSEFLKSLSSEVENAHYMNALTFLFETTLKDLMDFDKEEIKSIIVDKKTSCGLVDYWHGANKQLA